MKKHKALKILAIIFATICTFLLVCNIIPARKVIENNPFIKNDNEVIQIAAHRGGATNAPENTMNAYKKSVLEFDVDYLESDLWLTKDNKLVYNHDGYIDRVSDVNGDVDINYHKSLSEENRHYIKDYTLDELKKFNFGYFYNDENGNRPYKYEGNDKAKFIKDNDLGIVSLEEIFEMFYTSNPDLKFIIEIKDNEENGKLAADMLYDCLSNKYPNYLDQIVVGTYHGEVASYLTSNYPNLHIGASVKDAAGFIITEFFKVNIFNNPNFVCLQIPVDAKILKLDKKYLINKAHKRNIAVQYWTINDEKEMRKLIDLGADCIMTDNPKLLKEVINSYK